MILKYGARGDEVVLVQKSLKNSALKAKQVSLSVPTAFLVKVQNLPSFNSKKVKVFWSTEK
jgi:hypothetical protein